MTSLIHTQPRRETIRALALLCLGALFLRLPLLLSAPGADYDMESYARVARSMADGLGLYGNPELDNRYPYGPAWALLLWGLETVSQFTGGLTPLIFKLPQLLADLGITVLIYLMASRLAAAGNAGSPWWSTRAFWAALCWALNPVSALVSAGHGQFDSLALAFVLLAAWYIEFSENPRSDFAAALALGFAIAFKTWPLFFLPLFLQGLSGRRDKLSFAALSLALPILLLLPFVISLGYGPVLKSMAYSGSQAFSLPEALRGFFFSSGAPSDTYVAVASAWRSIAISALGLFWLAGLSGLRRFPLFAGLALATSTMYVFAPGLAAQYLVWLLPFALLIPGRLALRHSVVSLAALLIFYSLWAPGAFLKAGTWPALQLGPGFFVFWALLNLAFWFYLLREWLLLFRLCLRPSGRLVLS